MGDKKYSGKNLEQKRNTLPYADSTLGPIITIPDVESFKKDRSGNAKKYFKNKAEILQKDYDNLVDEVQVNQLLFNVEYNFVPITGKIYFLYHRDYNDTYFLSIIPPYEWDTYEFVGAYMFKYNDVWEKIDVENSADK